MNQPVYPETPTPVAPASIRNGSIAPYRGRAMAPLRGRGFSSRGRGRGMYDGGKWLFYVNYLLD